MLGLCRETAVRCWELHDGERPRIEVGLRTRVRRRGRCGRCGALGADGLYTTAQTTYDLRRLRLKGLIRRLPHSNTYHLTPDGVRWAVFYTKLHNRLLGPLLAADQPPASIELRRALKVIDNEVDTYLDHARIKAAA